MTNQEIQMFAKFGALWAALPTAVVGFISIVVQGWVGSRQSAAARLSAAASRDSAKASEMASLAAIKNAELKESELERDAVKFLSLQRREDILTLRSVLVDFHSVTLEKDSWTEEDMLKLRRLYGEIRLRIMPNSPQNEDLLLSVAEIYDKVMKIDVDGVRNTAAQFVLLSQKKLNNELRLIEKQIQNGKIE